MLNFISKFKQLPVGVIKPAGWLYRQLVIQKEGLSGNLDRFWPDIMDSKWFGGNADGWERAPYWLDGVIPLAYILDDLEFRNNIDVKMQLLFEKQQDDGWPFYMEPEDKNKYDLWAFLLISKVVYTYYTATGNKKCISYLLKLFKALDIAIDRSPLCKWGQYRWFEGIMALMGVYRITGDNRLPALARRLMDQGFNWYDFYNAPNLETPAEKRRWSFDKHVVNNAMAIKATGIAYALTGEKQFLENLTTAIDRLDEYHGYVTGAFSGDECLAGKSPVQGTELCAIVEYMYSLEILIEMFGKGELSDRLEKLTFNTLPATFLPDMWSHQYDQQLNQVECSVKTDRTWTTNGPESNIFGLEPNFGCCTANLSQGWPKYAANLWMETHDNGLAVVSYAPCRFSHRINGVNIMVTVDTEYPFRDDINITITPSGNVSFPVYLYIPGRCKKPLVYGVDCDIENICDGYIKVYINGSSIINIKLVLPSDIEIIKTKDNTVSVVKGPLVYSLPIVEKIVRIHEEDPMKQLPHGDFELYPASEWRYALDLSGKNYGLTYEELEYESSGVFSPANAPSCVYAHARLVEGWGITNGSCNEIDQNLKPSGDIKIIKLIPYGCTNLRITEFPIVKS